MGKLISSMRVLNSSKKNIENGTELVTTIEVLREDGAKWLADGLVRTTETDKSISVVGTVVIRKFASHQDTRPSDTDVLTTLIDTAKGEVEGDHRWDTVELTSITKEGIHKAPAQRRRSSLAHRQTELSDQEALDRVLAIVNRESFGRPAAPPLPPTPTTGRESET